MISKGCVVGVGLGGIQNNIIPWFVTREIASGVGFVSIE